MKTGNARKITTHDIAVMGLLTALMLVLGYLENMFPIPLGVPGVKLGLSNGVLLFALYMMNVPSALMLMVVKVVLSGLMFGGASAMMFAFAGGALSMLAMIPLSKVKGVHIVTVSIVGAVCHNVGQVLLAMIILKTSNLIYYMAVLMLIALVTGTLTGVCAKAVMSHLKHMKFMK